MSWLMLLPACVAALPLHNKHYWDINYFGFKCMKCGQTFNKIGEEIGLCPVLLSARSVDDGSKESL